MFNAGVSRFVIIVTVVVAWFVISIVDGIFDTILYRLGRRYQLAVVSTDP